MDFALSEEQRDFVAAVGEFARRRLRPHYGEDDRRGELRPELLGELAGLGLTGLLVPTEHGGQGADALTAGLAFEQVGRFDLNAAYLMLVPALVGAVLRGGDAEQQRRFLPPLAAGEALPCFCLTEPEHGSDAAGLRLRAEPAGDGWRLHGEKTSISLGAYASTALVFARTSGEGADGVSAFYLELDDRRLRRSRIPDVGSRAIGRAALHFDAHPAPPGSLIGPAGEGFRLGMRGFDLSRALIALICLGTAAQALEEATAYARQRRTFGRPLSAHQGVAFPLVEAETQLRAARWLCYEALWRFDQGLPHAAEAGMVKWWVPKLAVEVAHQALLTLGHAGYSEELPAGQRVRDLIGLEIGDGTAQIAKLVVARRLFGREFAP